MNVVVTGCAGFSGWRVSALLLAEGHRVTEGAAGGKGEGIKVLKGDRVRDKRPSEVVNSAPLGLGRRRRGLGVAVAWADLMGLLMVSLLVAHLRFDLRVAGAPLVVTALLTPLVWVAAFLLEGPYRFPCLHPVEEFRRAVSAGAVASVSMFAASYLLKVEVPHSVVLVMLPGGVGVAIFGRWVGRAFLRARGAGGALLRTAVVGCADEVGALVSALLKDRLWRPLGVVLAAGGTPPSGMPVAGAAAGPSEPCLERSA